MVNVEVLEWVRKVIELRPERHDQNFWLRSAFDDPDTEESPFYTPVKAAGLAEWGLRGLPEWPEDPENALCGTQGCVAGWLALRTAPDGALVDGSCIYIPDVEGEWARRGRMMFEGIGGGYRRESISEWAERESGLGSDVCGWLFSPCRSRQQILWALEWLTRPGNEGADRYDIEEACPWDGREPDDYDD